MAISAFGERGRLKKHALMGSSLGQDPRRSKERKKFRGLHEEARQAKMGRKGMTGLLRDRLQMESTPQFSRLEQIRAKRQSLAQQYAGGRDPGLEKGFKAYETYVDLGGPTNLSTPEGFKDFGISNEFAEQARRGWSKLRSDEGGSVGPGSAHGGYDLPEGVELPQRPAYSEEMSPQERQAETSRYLQEMSALDLPASSNLSVSPNASPAAAGYLVKAVGESRDENQQRLAEYTKQQFADKYGPAAAKKYRKKLASKASQLNQAYIPLGEEATTRQKRLSEKVNLYNMFLGV